MENYTIPLEKAVDLTPVSSQLDTFTNAQQLWSFVGGYGVYGGSTVAHCLVAAQKTIPSDYVAHSLYCSFVAPANPKQRIEYRVERTRDAKSFLTRTVHATQKAKSSDTDRAGRLEHGPKRPEGLTVPDEAEMDGKGIDGPFEMRWGEVLNQRPDDLVHTRIRYWMRAKEPMQQTDPQVQLAALSYMSDAYFIGAAVQVYGVPGQTFGTKMAMAASLNHAIYFHHPDAVRADEWMCSERESPWAGNDRALVMQRIWSLEGLLVASCVQEGVLRVQAPFEKTVIVSRDPQVVKALLTTQFGDFGKGERFHTEWREFLGDAIFTTDGDKWHASRALIRPMFTRDRVSNLSTFERHVQKLLRILESPRHERQPVNVLDLCLRLTMDIATDFLLGQSVDSLSNPTHRFSAAFADVQRIQSSITMAGPLQVFLPKAKYYEGLKTINSFVDPFITRTLALGRRSFEEMEGSEEENNFLEGLATFTQDPKVIRDQLIFVLLAARDTTAATLARTLYELSGHPEVVQRLREEILAQVGTASAPTYADLKNMRYLQAILKETLRLYPAIPFNMRVALSDTTLPSGGVAYSPLYMHRSDLYPDAYADGTPFPDPREYHPHRWMYPGSKTADSEKINEGPWIPKPWTYIPFNGGPRICLGQQFALAEMGYTLVRIFQKYKCLERRMRAEDDGLMRANIVLTPAQEVNVVFIQS
ncbi:hypothetical protein KXW02_007889 [Aspergillus fumigatus]|nr:hypothetical protein KXW02_007889 [Aspergillus fumigatus]